MGTAVGQKSGPESKPALRVQQQLRASSDDGVALARWLARIPSTATWPRGSEAVTRCHLALTVVDFPENEEWGLAASGAKSQFL